MDCIVAPHEADAQLAYLNQAGIAQIIITEDSDLILFGCNQVHTSSTLIQANVYYIGISLVDFIQT